MLTDFFGAVTGKLAERWVAALLTPAFIFWAGGVGAIWHQGWAPLATWLAALSQTEAVALLVGCLLLVGISAVVVNTATLPVLRALEGYWPRVLRPVRRVMVRWQKARLKHADDRLQQLLRKGLEHLDAEELEEYTTLDWRLAHAPTNSDQVMPSALGNILRAAERHAGDRYGLDAVICWPHLWLLLPDSAKQELTQARASLDTAVRVSVWAVLFIVWTPWMWWAAPLGLLAAIATYRWMVSVASTYGDLLDGAFDLYRTSLYTSLRWPLPANPAQEREIGEKLTLYLWRGSDASTPTFSEPQ